MSLTPTHLVRSGETLSSIATLESVDISELAALNGIKNRNRIREGQALKLPPSRIKKPTNPEPPTLPPKRNQPETPSNTTTTRELVEEWIFESINLTQAWLDELLVRLRTKEAAERTQKTEPVPVEKSEKRKDYTPKQPPSPGSVGPQTLSEVKKALRESLGKEPHIVVFDGVKLTQNEKKQIIAGVSVVEMGKQGFGSINADQEFVGKRHGNRGIETGYSRIVHIGLSYGVIQYTQDSGSLGELLKKMHAKNPDRFIEIFGDGDAAVADSLIELTTSGHRDLKGSATVPLSGQVYWNSIAKTAEGKNLATLANASGKSTLPKSMEIRGKRVQPLIPKKGTPAIDIWTGIWKERFVAAGKCVEFQEVQLEMAVSNYLDKILKLAQKYKVRSALSLAFIAACAIRGGPASRLATLFYSVAEAMGIQLPFSNSADERRCIDKIADTPMPPPKQHKTTLLGITIDADEIRRARRLRNDELGFLLEDYYDVSTYL